MPGAQQGQSLKEALKKKLENCRRLLVLGVGSDLRSDDGAGAAVADRVRPAFVGMSNVKVMTGGNAPENLTGEIRRFHPGLVILIDAVHMGGLPGETRLFEPDEVEGVSFSTHGMPLCVLAGFLRVSVGADVIILGIQAGSLELMGPLSGSVASSVETAALLLKEAVLEQFSG